MSFIGVWVGAILAEIDGALKVYIIENQLHMLAEPWRHDSDRQAKKTRRGGRVKISVDLKEYLVPNQSILVSVQGLCRQVT